MRSYPNGEPLKLIAFPVRVVHTQSKFTCPVLPFTVQETKKLNGFE